MSIRMNRRTFVGATLAASVFKPTLALAEATRHEIEMLNQHPEDRSLRQVFFPRIQVIAPGDTVAFLATDRGHNSASVEGMIPEAAEGWDGKINQEIEVTLETPGVYGYECTPHASVGMVGLIIVEGEGMLDNLEAAQSVRQRGRARSVWEDIWEEVASMDLGTS